MQLSPRMMDNAGIDITVTVPGVIGDMQSPRFDAQVKCTTNSSLIKETQIHYSLPVHNYKRLIHPYPGAPQFLIIVFVPKDLSEWVQTTEENLTLQKTAYWISLKGEPSTDLKTAITVHIPRTNLLTPQSLKGIMQRISDEDQMKRIADKKL